VFLSTSNYEGYGMTFVEALASGCAIVSTAVGIMGYEVKEEEGVVICPVADAKCISAKLIDLMEDQQKLHTLKLRAPEAARRLIVSKESYLAAYRQSWENALK
jgi:glycosyltransferase involved in cell wall biosynthesis